MSTKGQHKFGQRNRDTRGRYSARCPVLTRVGSRCLVLLLVCALSPLPVRAAEPVEEPLRLGTAWYPEQWPESRWDADLALMEAAHLNVVRLGEFAWSTMEPSEGHYDFAWLDRAIALAAQHHLAVVLGTPTAAPPAWLTAKYPDTLRVEEDGHRAEHGNREQFSFASPRYRLLAAGIAQQMARRYGHNPHVLGWQIDNEIGAPTFDRYAQAQWHRWLARKYGSIGRLNALWTTAYWSQTYDRFDEVPFHSRNENPALLLDYRHFVTETWNDYVQNQVAVLRPLIEARQWITTNTMHWNSTFDHYKLHQGLDLAAWDDYFPDGHLDPMLNAAEHDLVRGYKGRNFWVMETQPAFVNWGPVNAALPPGVVREMAWQAVGHGAEAVLYWQWRSAGNGQEQYHGTLLGADGLPVPVYAEVQRVGEEFHKVGELFSGTSPQHRVAILQSYVAHWAVGFQPHTRLFDYVDAVMEVYRAVEPRTQGVNMVGPEADLSRYTVVFAPALNVLPQPLADRLLAWVRAGGHLVLTARSGMKNEYDGLQTQGQPGPLAAALGAHVEQFYALDPKDPKPTLDGTLGKGSASVWAEVLHLDDPDARVLLRYGQDQSGANGWLAGQPAAVEHAVGKGTLTYLGAVPDAALMQQLVDAALHEGGVDPLLAGLPAGVELMSRTGQAHRSVWVLINHNTTQQDVSLPQPMRDLLGTAAAAPSASLHMNAHDVAVLVPAEGQ